jgi:dinuclear metal center YbgI/SA1388 family protein
MADNNIQLGEVTDHLESVAPIEYQESYDNSGLITGNRSMPVNGILVSLDCTEAVVDEAIARGCNVVVAHHPIVFSGLKRITGRTYVERTVIKAIKNDVAIYAIHTNLDNANQGVNRKICDKIGIQNARILDPKPGLLNKLVTFVPLAHVEAVQAAVFAQGAGKIGNYDECSFQVEGTGEFRGNEDSKPFVGEKGARHREAEIRFETIVPAHTVSRVLAALIKAHPYKEPAWDLIPLSTGYAHTGSGMVGELPAPLEPEKFLALLKASLELNTIRYTELTGRNIRRVAVCGGAGSFLLKKAIAAGADAFVTSDFKYHEFFDAEGRTMICDIGHYESENCTKELLRELIVGKFSTFAVLLSEINTNPVKYY